jgi:hypothetical protein
MNNKLIQPDDGLLKVKTYSCITSKHTLFGLADL